MLLTCNKLYLLDSSKLMNNWSIIHLLHKSTHFEEFEEIHQVVIDRIINNMASLVQYGEYGAIEKYCTTTN